MSASSVRARAAQLVPRWLEDWTGLPVRRRELGTGPDEPDLCLEWGEHGVIAEVRSGARTAQVASGLEALRRLGAERPHALRLLIVPKMGPAGEARCRAADVAWVDLAGNAEIRVQGAAVHRRGEEGPSEPQSRNPFSPKASALTRELLQQPHRWVRQEDLVDRLSLDRGYVSRICRELDRHELTERDSQGRLRPRDPLLLLDAWREEYRPLRGHTEHGYVAARSGAAVLQRVADALESSWSLTHAVTGLAAAWLWTQHVSFGRSRIYVLMPLTSEQREHIGFQGVDKGGNVDFIVPADEGVVEGAVLRKGARCVSRVQAYLDLKGEAERAAEAAEELRRDIVRSWEGHRD